MIGVARQAGRRTLAGMFVTSAVCLVAAGAAAQQSAALDEAFTAFWSARTLDELNAATAKILATKPGIEQVFSRLRQGRPYSPDVAKGRHLLRRKNTDGTQHLYVVHVPEDYDPALRYPTRVYLHGGVMRPKREDGKWWPNDGGFARPDSIVVFPASWERSIWWQTRSRTSPASSMI